MSNNGNSRISQYERRLARQRQMEAMEAAASGTAPTMELDTSVIVDTSLRSRTPPSAIMSDEPVSPTRVSKSLRSSALFERESIRPSVNLMDHTTGVYQERASFSERLSSAIQSSVGGIFRVSDKHGDASPSFDDDIYDQQSVDPKRKKRLSPTSAACRRVLRNRLALLLIALVLIGVIVGTTMVFVTSPAQARLKQENNMRYSAILDHIVLEGISHAKIFDDHYSPQWYALRWVAFADPARMDPLDPMILQRYALAVFYYSSFKTYQHVAGKQKSIINGDGEDQYMGVPDPGWLQHDNWLTGAGHCTWFGVECVPHFDENNNAIARYDESRNVRKIDMTGNHVQGTIPSEFKAFEKLEILDLAKNKLQGTIPYQIFRNYDLKHLLLNENRLTGTLSTFIGELEAIRDLRVGSNKLTGTLPVEMDQLFELRYLSLENNEFTGRLPDLAKLRLLVSLWADNNKLTGQIPLSFGELQALQDLHLHNNAFGGTIPHEVQNLVKLKVLDLEYNQIGGTISEAIFANMKFLEYVSLQHNQMQGPIPLSLGEVTSLKELHLNDNQFTGQLPHWTKLSNLRLFHMQNNQVAGSIPSSFGHMKATEVWMQNNKIGGSIPPEVGWIHPLETLYLENNNLGGNIPTALSELKELEELRLFGNKIQGLVPWEVCELTSQGSLMEFQADCSGHTLKCKCCTCVR